MFRVNLKSFSVEVYDSVLDCFYFCDSFSNSFGLQEVIMNYLNSVNCYKYKNYCDSHKLKCPSTYLGVVNRFKRVLNDVKFLVVK